MFFFFKQKTAYEMRISDWSSDVCSSDLFGRLRRIDDRDVVDADAACNADLFEALEQAIIERLVGVYFLLIDIILDAAAPQVEIIALQLLDLGLQCLRSEEHTSELQSLMRISYDVFCLKKKI